MKTSRWFLIIILLVLNSACGGILSSLVGPVASFAVCRNSTATQWNDVGAGTDADPYVICTPAQFASIGQSQAAWSKSFALGANLDLSKYDGSTPALTLAPIGFWDTATNSNSVPFTGKFDGRGMILKNLKLAATTNHSVGIFGYIQASNIKSFVITGVNVTGAQLVGGLIGRSDSSLVSDVSIAGTVTASAAQVGGLIGLNVASGASANASVSRATSAVTVLGQDTVGGLIGQNLADTGAHADISTCSATGTVGQSGAGNSFGGLIGYNETSGGASATITDSSSSGDVTLPVNSGFSGSFSGAFVGTNIANGAGSTVSMARNHVSGSITAYASLLNGYVGGLIGLNRCQTAANCSVSSSSATGNVTILAGYNNRSRIGVLIGYLEVGGGSNGDVSDCFAAGTLSLQSTGGTQIGGLIGDLESSNAVAISRTYASVSITASSPGATVGAIIGDAPGVSFVTVTNSYWNSDLAAIGSGVAVSGIAARTTNQLKAQANFTGWDFVSVWKISEGASLPTLRQ